MSVTVLIIAKQYTNVTVLIIAKQYTNVTVLIIAKQYTNVTVLIIAKRYTNVTVLIIAKRYTNVTVLIIAKQYTNVTVLIIAKRYTNVTVLIIAKQYTNVTVLIIANYSLNYLTLECVLISTNAPPPPRLHKLNLVIRWIFFGFWPNLKKVFHLFVELVKTNLLSYNTLQFDQYSRLAISLNILWFSAINSKKNLKKSFILVCRAHWDESNDVITSNI